MSIGRPVSQFCFTSESFVKYLMWIYFYCSPPDPSTLQQARKKRLKELKTNAALKEIFAFFVFLILLMDVAQYHRTPDTFLLSKTLYETFEEVDAYGLDLTTVSSGISKLHKVKKSWRIVVKCYPL